MFISMALAQGVWADGARPGANDLKKMRAHLSALMGSDEKSNVTYFTDFITEAHEQKSAEDEAFGWLMLLYYYYNGGMDEELQNTMPEALSHIKSLGYNNYYYDARILIPESEIYKGNVLHAIHESRLVIDEAYKNNDAYGEAASNMVLGKVYLVMMQSQEAVNHFELAIRQASGVDKRYRLLGNIYPYYADALISLKQFVKLRKVCDDWRKAIDLHAQSLRKQNLSTASLKEHYEICQLIMARAKAELGQLDEAKADFDAMAGRLDQYSPYIKNIYYRELTCYYMLRHNFPLALNASNLTMKLGLEVGDSVTLLSYQERHAHLLMAVGRNEEAAQLLSHLLDVRDSLHTFSTQKQMAEMSTFLKLHEVEDARERARMLMWTAFAGLVTIGIILAFYVRFNVRLARKEKAMLQTVKRFKLSWQLNLQSLQSKPQDSLSGKEQLYVSLCKLMDDGKPYLKLEFNRDTLTAELNTNRTYLADAIRTYADGMSISKFITRYRLQYAASLLIGRKDLNVDEIGSLSGFNSRSTYLRLFRDYFGLTPAAFRNNSTDFSPSEAKGNANG
jgi:AraC-like DNA-binding protein